MGNNDLDYCVENFLLLTEENKAKIIDFVLNLPSKPQSLIPVPEKVV